MLSRKECVSWTRDTVLKRKSAPELICKNLESERGGTEVVESAIYGQSPLSPGFRHTRGKEVFERSHPP